MPEQDCGLKSFDDTRKAIMEVRRLSIKAFYLLLEAFDDKVSQTEKEYECLITLAELCFGGKGVRVIGTSVRVSGNKYFLAYGLNVQSIKNTLGE